MQQKTNFLIFLVSVAGFGIALYYLLNTFFPVPPPAPPAPPSLSDTQKQLAFAASLTARVPSFTPDWDGAFQLVAEVAVSQSQWAATGVSFKAPPSDLDRLRENPPYRGQIAAVVGAGALAAWDRNGLPSLADPVISKGRPEWLTLGSRASDSPYHLGVLLDPHGAGLRSVTLNKFQQADAMGKPQWQLGSDGKPLLDSQNKKLPLPMELVPQIMDGLPTTPSNLLYHYDINDPNSDRPLDTLAHVDWQVVEKKEDEAQQSVALAADIQGVRITKTFSLRKGEYHVGLEVKVERSPNAPVTDKKFRYQLAGAHGLRVEGQWYTSTFRQALIGLLDKESDLRRQLQDLRYISLREGGDEYRAEQDRRILYAGIGVQFFASVVVVDNEQDNKDFLASVRPTLETRVVKIEVDELVTKDASQYRVVDKKNPGKSELYDLTPQAAFALASVPKGTKVGLLCRPGPSNRLVVLKVLSEADTQPMFYDDINVRVNTRPLELSPEPNKPIVHKYLLYNGPVKVKLLGDMTGVEAVSPELVTRYADTLHLRTLTDYHSPGFMGNIANTIGWTFLLIHCTNLMHSVLWFIHSLIPYYGICIVVLTVLVRGLMFPVSRKQAMTSMRMQELQPELKKLQEKYKDDRQAYGMAQMELFRKNKVNPFGSCWMLLLQMPVFMGLYYSLQESVHFRLAPFLWIENLAAPDMLWEWGDNIPWISRHEDYGSLLYLGPYLNLLPIIAVTLMILQQKMMMPPPADEQAAMQQKMMKYMMVFFGIMFYKVAGGLCIYFIASSAWGFAERKLLPKKKPVGEEPPPADGMLQRVLGRTDEPASTAVRDVAPAGSTAFTDKAGANKLNRRQERNRRKSAKASGGRGKDQEDDDTGWWASMRKKISDWWAEVQRQAERKK